MELVHTVICGIFDEAVEDGIIESNPARGLLKKILPRKVDRHLKEPDPFDIEERDRFLASAMKMADFKEAMFLRVLAFMGLRLGEALAMRTSNFDTERKLYQVTQSYKRSIFGKPKNGKFRFVDVPDFLMEELKEYILRIRKESLKCGHGGDVDLLFCEGSSEKQDPFTQRRIQEVMKRVCRKAGLRRRSPHQLRHSYASILLMAHQSVAYVSRQLGHSSIDTTIRYYCHWIPGEGRDGLEDALCPKPKNKLRLVEG